MSTKQAGAYEQNAAEEAAHDTVLYLLDRVSRYRLLRLVVLSDDQPGTVDSERYL